MRAAPTTPTLAGVQSSSTGSRVAMVFDVGTKGRRASTSTTSYLGSDGFFLVADRILGILRCHRLTRGPAPRVAESRSFCGRCQTRSWVYAGACHGTLWKSVMRCFSGVISCTEHHGAVGRRTRGAGSLPSRVLCVSSEDPRSPSTGSPGSRDARWAGQNSR